MTRHLAEEGRIDMQNIAEQNLPLVGLMVRRFAHHNADPEELYQQGCIGLMKAIARYDPAYGTAFSTYAAAMILGEMRMLCRSSPAVHIPRREREQRLRIRKMQEELTRRLEREPNVQELAEALHMDAEEMVFMLEDITVASADAASDSGTSLLDSIADEDDWQQRLELRDLISRLPAPDRRLMLLRHVHCLSQAETAKLLRLTQVQVSRRERELKCRLKQAWYDET